MKIVSNDFKTNVNSFGRQLDTIITYNNTTLTRDNIYNINPNFHTNIMETLMKCMIVETDTLIPIGTRINVQSGVKVGNDYEYIDYGYYTVKEYQEDKNKKSYIMKCYDDMMLTMVDYDLNTTYPISIKNLLIAICNHFNFTLGTATFVNDDSMITTNVFSNINYTYRDVLDELAMVTCSMIEVENNVMYIKYPNTTNVVVNEDILNDENVVINEKYGPVNSLVLSRIDGADSISRQDTSSIETNGLTEIKLNDKQIFSTNDRSNYIQEMFESINGYQYYICNLDTQGLMYLEAMDKFNISVNNVSYPTILLNDETNISDGLNEEIYNNALEKSQTEYKYTTQSDKSVKNAYIIVDKQNAIITQTAEAVDEQNSKISTIEQTVNEINSKISDIADVTTSAEDTDAQVELANINASNPIDIIIHPIIENICYLYPTNNLYPSSTTYLKSRKLRFTNTSTNENFYWELPTNLWYYDNENYDELNLSYGDGTNPTVIVNRKCGINADGSVYLLATPTIETYSYPYDVNLTDGDYVVTLLGYSNAYLFVRLMASNIYTQQFATKVEMNSAIEQSASTINLSVAQKLDSSEFNSANIMLTINNDGTSNASINADKININGIITAINNNTTTTIDGSKITTGTITADEIQANTITANKIVDNSITSTQIADSTITGGKIANDTITSTNISTLSANKISSGTITSSNINLNSGTVKLRSNGHVEFTNSSGFFSMGPAYGSAVAVVHPYVSALNIANGAGGLVFYDGTAISSVGSNKASIHLAEGKYLKIEPGSRFYIDSHYGLTGQAGIKDSNGNTFYLAFWKGLMVGASRSAFSTSTYPWLI